MEETRTDSTVSVGDTFKNLPDRYKLARQDFYFRTSNLNITLTRMLKDAY